MSKKKQRKKVQLDKKKGKKEFNLVTYYRSLAGKLGRIPLWLIPLVIAVITFFTVDLEVTSDMGWYMNSALNILKGNGYADMDHSLIFHRAPCFPLMITASFWLLGVSVFSAFWVVRIFAILNPLLIYFVGKKFFNKWVGLIASLLVLTSFSVNYWSYRHLDAVWPFFIMLFILFTYNAFEKRSMVWFILSGISLGIAFLIKEIVIVFIPLPVLAFIFIRDYRSRKNAVALLIFAFSFLLVLSPWVIYVYTKTGELGSMLGGGSTVGRELLSSDETGGGINLYAGVKNYLIGLGNYFFHPAHEHSIYRNFALVSIFSLAWIFTIGAGFRRNKSSILLLLVAVLFSPLLAYFGQNNMRLGQGILFFLVTYLVTADFLLRSVKYTSAKLSSLGTRSNWGKIIPRAGIVTTVLILIGIQMFVGEKRNIDFLRRSTVAALISGCSARMEVSGSFALPFNKAAGDWISQNLPAGTRLMVSKPSEGKSLFFYSEGRYPIHQMPVIQTNKLNECTSERSSLIFLSSWVDYVDPQNKLYALLERDLLEALVSKDIQYIIVADRRNYLTIYFEANPGFERVAEFADGKLKIFEFSRRVSLSDFEPLIARRALRYLKQLELQDREYYEFLTREFFFDILGWSEELVEKIENGTYGRPVRNWYTY